jgi:hypothetical protein
MCFSYCPEKKVINLSVARICKYDKYCNPLYKREMEILLFTNLSITEL